MSPKFIFLYNETTKFVDVVEIRINVVGTVFYCWLANSCYLKCSFVKYYKKIYSRFINLMLLVLCYK